VTEVRFVRFMSLAQKVVRQNDGDFVDVILLYKAIIGCFKI